MEVWEFGESGLVVRGRARPQLSLIHRQGATMMASITAVITTASEETGNGVGNKHTHYPAQHFSKDAFQSISPPNALC